MLKISLENIATTIHFWRGISFEEHNLLQKSIFYQVYNHGIP